MGPKTSAINVGRPLSSNNPDLSFQGSTATAKSVQHEALSGQDTMQAGFTECPVLLRKQRIRSATYFVLLAIFMAVQWTSPHAHLTGVHEHSGDLHQHSAEIHAHQLVAIHADAIDVGHIDLADAWVVEYDHPQLPSVGQQPDTDQVVLVTQFRLPDPTAPGSFRLSEATNPLPDLLPAHIGQPRAPPRLA